jgi:ribosomal protein S18 acetylase RimI-like enzyme
MLGVTSLDLDGGRELLDRLEQYYDAVPRSAARVEDLGPLSLFIREGQGWPYPVLPSALAVPHLAFADPGTHVGAAGIAELSEAVRSRADDGSVEHAVARILAGLTCVAAAVEDGQALCAGQHQPVGPVSEIVGVGTLPTARRRGLALAVTAALIADARSRGVETVFLSAGDDDVARIYARLGFRRMATALIAEPVE